MTVSLTIVSALAAIGLVIAWFVLREYVDRVRKDLHTDAYEEGWSHGYDVGNKHSHDPHGTASVDDGEEVE